MSTNKTENYQLHKWEAGDDFLRTEFNENFSAIDATLHGKAEVVFGTYTGTGAFSQAVTLGFTPSIVLVMSQDGTTRVNSVYCGGIAALDTPARYDDHEIVAIKENGFQVFYSDYGPYANAKNRIYHYLAFR